MWRCLALPCPVFNKADCSSLLYCICRSQTIPPAIPCEVWHSGPGAAAPNDLVPAVVMYMYFRPLCKRTSDWMKTNLAWAPWCKIYNSKNLVSGNQIYFPPKRNYSGFFVRLLVDRIFSCDDRLQRYQHHTSSELLLIISYFNTVFHFLNRDRQEFL